MTDFVVKQASDLRHDFSVLSSSLKSVEKQFRVLSEDLKPFNTKVMNNEAAYHSSKTIKQRIEDIVNITPDRLSKHALDAAILGGAEIFAHNLIMSLSH